MTSYKEQHTAFVSDHTGSSIHHLLFLSLISLTSLTFYTTLRTRIQHFPPRNPTLLFLVQFILLVLPLLLSVTYAAYGTGLLAFQWNIIFLCLSASFIALWEPKLQRLKEILPSSSPNPATRQAFPSEKELSIRLNSFKKEKDGIRKLEAVTNWRAHMMLLTSVAILAVDFQVFPRQLAKCETWGVSLMDIGVGSFIFSQGVASSLPLLRDSNHLSGAYLPKIWRSIRRNSPLIALGLARLVIVKSTDYPGEHVSEYGTHWNFFLTLACIPPLQIALHPLFHYLPVSLVGLFIGLAHQLLLTLGGLQTWALTIPRTDLITHNKEGLVSLLGYLAIHLLGLSTGLLILPPRPSYFKHVKGGSDGESSSEDEDAEAYAKDAYIDESKRAKRKEEREDGKTAIELCSYGVLYAILFIGTKFVLKGEDVSRRLANLQYVLFVSTFNLFFLLLYILHDLYFYPSPNTKPRATDTAHQLGPTADPADDVYGTSTAISSSAGVVASDYAKRPSLDGRHSTPSVRPSSRQGYLTVEDPLDEGSNSEGGASKKQKRFGRRSWDGSDLKVGRDSNVSEGGEASAGHASVGSDEEGVKRAAPELFEAVNRNGLVVFLLANVLTGLVNLSIETIYVSDGKSMLILTGYLFVVCAFAWAFRGRRLLAL